MHCLLRKYQGEEWWEAIVWHGIFLVAPNQWERNCDTLQSRHHHQESTPLTCFPDLFCAELCYSNASISLSVLLKCLCVQHSSIGTLGRWVVLAPAIFGCSFSICNHGVFTYIQTWLLYLLILFQPFLSLQCNSNLLPIYSTAPPPSNPPHWISVRNNPLPSPPPPQYHYYYQIEKRKSWK